MRADDALKQIARSRAYVERLELEATATRKAAAEARRAWEEAVRSHFQLERMLDDGDGLPLFESVPDVEQG
jgi:hypothetical protein